MSDHSDESDDGSFSDGGDAQNAKKHWLGKAKVVRKPPAVKKQRKARGSTFIDDALREIGLTLENSGKLGKRPSSKCLCGKVIVNEMKKWREHSKLCSNKAAKNTMLISAGCKPTPLVLVLNAAAETARKKLADQYVMTYWMYQNKLPFTTGEKLQEVTGLILKQMLFFYFTIMLFPFSFCFRLNPQLMQCLNCCDEKAVEKLSLSRQSVARSVTYICIVLTSGILLLIVLISYFIP
jgi:hypothetical protein